MEDPIDSMDKASDAPTVPHWTRPEAYDYSKYEIRDDARDWAGNARIYDWDGDHGDVGPEYPELEEELFGPLAERSQVRGIDFSK
jgi:ATP-dependent RNA helicase DDX3X